MNALMIYKSIFRNTAEKERVIKESPTYALIMYKSILRNTSE